jgi:hypothetical protein
VIGHLPVPLLAPDETERGGYIPNVLYSCGGLIRSDALVLPYGFSDHGINIPLISVAECRPSRAAPRFERALEIGPSGPQLNGGLHPPVGETANGEWRDTDSLGHTISDRGHKFYTLRQPPFSETFKPLLSFSSS